MLLSSNLPVGRVALGGAVQSATTALAGSLLLALSAKLQVPFWPVPMTMQTLAVLTLAAWLGPRLGVATVCLYVFEGICGLPVFAGAAAGPAYLFGPTGGYLAGFVVAAFVVGRLVDRGWTKSLGWAVVVMVLGHGAIFAPGVAWLAVGLGPEKALAFGITPFFAATVLKTLLGAALVRAVPPHRFSSRWNPTAKGKERG